MRHVVFASCFIVLGAVGVDSDSLSEMGKAKQKLAEKMTERKSVASTDNSATAPSYSNSPDSYVSVSSTRLQSISVKYQHRLPEGDPMAPRR